MDQDGMKNIIVDTCVLVSFYDTSDSLNQKANIDLKKASEQANLWVTYHIIDEFFTLMQKKNLKQVTYGFKELLDSKIINIFYPERSEITDNLHSKILNEYYTQTIKASYTDLHIKFLRDLKIIPNCEVLSYDGHFNV